MSITGKKEQQLFGELLLISERSPDARRKILMQEITFAKGNEQHLKDCKDGFEQEMTG